MFAGLGRAVIAVAALATGAAAEAVVTPWHVDAPWFGGFSGIDLSDDGRDFIALSDRGYLVAGAFTRTADGAIAAITVLDHAPLTDTDGAVLQGPMGDSEGIARSPDGTLFISFEHQPRVTRQMGLHGLPEILPRHADFGALPRNRALEALAVDSGGGLYTLPEGGGPVYYLGPGSRDWQIIFHLPTDGQGWAAVGADFGPDGRLYILERAFRGIGFQSRIRSMTRDGTDIRGEFTSAMGRFGNLEGISVWQGKDNLVATLIADDNFGRLLPSQIVEIQPLTGE
ncbi:esterase-like activity of phytase family protein [Ketogulonicigenium vulgare]|uniref:esterase-like activity of phytase family protein n=1 Tax=Ketogulonicigenium vulgare TaxID=92945 RepID=UPI002358B47D|nr:esterase-like activity of phytase family protein [Ketogulonicigenium vulgare]